MYLQKETHSLVLIGRCSQETLRIQGDQAQRGVVRGPHAHGAGAGRLGGVEHALAPEQDVVERVGLAIASVAEDGEHLDPGDVRAAEPLHKVGLLVHLEEERRGYADTCLFAITESEVVPCWKKKYIYIYSDIQKSV